MINKELIEKALQNIKGLAEYEFFFDNLTKPDWILPLHDKDLFSDPFKPIRKNDFIKFPIWPQSRYLQRMANKDADTVLKVMLEIPETDNVRIHEDFVKAACKMPVNLAAKVAEKEVKWIDKQNHLYFLLPRELGKLISYLAKGGEIEIALKLSKVLLCIIPVQNNKKQSGEDKNISQNSYLDSKTRIRLSDYQQVINKYIIPDLVPAAQMKTLDLLTDLLQNAIVSLYREIEGPDDHSHQWRRAIEDHEQNLASNIEYVLVEAVRDASDKLMQKHGRQVLSFLEDEKRQYKIFFLSLFTGICILISTYSGILSI